MRLGVQFLRLCMVMLLLACHFSSTSQPYARNEKKYWAFGQGAGIDFNGATPVAVKTEIHTESSTASSVADHNGNLLFYTDGVTVYDKNGTAMLNGNNIWTPAGQSNIPYQGALITSVPGEKNKYYVFSHMNPYSSVDTFKVLASVVDMSLNNGLGDVEANRRGIHVTKGIDVRSFTMAAIQGDSCNIWLLVQANTKDASNKNDIYAYNITKEGISVTPVVTPGIGFTLSSYQGAIKFSSNRKKLLLAGFRFLPPNPRPPPQGYSEVIIADFNPSTGVVTNPMTIFTASGTGTPEMFTWSGEFSPDGTKVYARYGNEIYQWDISLPTQAQIIASQVNVFTMSTFGRTGFQLAPDGKIYFIEDHGNPTGTNNIYVHAIQQPNLAGTACQADTNVLQTVPGTTTGYLLTHVPVIVQPVLQGDTVGRYFQDTVVCGKSGTTWELYARPGFDHYTWYNGDTGSVGTITDTGIYWVGYEDQCTYYVDTYKVGVAYITPVINIDEFKLGTTQPYISYQWLLNGEIIPGATDSVYYVTENGDYQVSVADSGGCTGTSAIYTVENVGVESAEFLRSIKVYPNPVSGRLFISLAEPLPRLDIRLCNIMGQEMEVHTISGVKEFGMDISAYAAGMYIVEIRSGDKVSRIKVIKD